jgi:hypothetical protein
MKIRPFWDVAACSAVGVDDVSEVRTAYIIVPMETVCTSETFVYFKETTR